MGREPGDSWIEVKHAADAHPWEDMDPLAENRVKRFRTIREAIVLLSIFAQVDYDSWLAELVRTTKFKPRKYMDLEMHKLPCKWAFRFGNAGDSIRISQWTMLRDLFGFKNLSHEFRRDFKRTSVLALEHGVDVRAMEPIPIQIQFAPRIPSGRTAAEVQALQGLTQTIVEMLAVEADQNEQRRTGPSERPPVFCIKQLEVDLQQYGLHTAVLTEIRHLLETGMPVQRLSLPDGRLVLDSENASVWLPVWGPLLQLATGSARTCGGVRRLVVPMKYCQGILLAPLMTALAAARCLEHVRLEFHTYFGQDDASNWRLWAWLGVAMLNDASNSSVTCLEIVGYRLDDRSMRELRKAKEAMYPLSYLWGLFTEDQSISSSLSGCPSRCLKPVTVMKGSRLVPCGSSDATQYFEAPSDIEGYIDQANENENTGATAQLLLPGYGLCSADCSALKSKRQRLSEDAVLRVDAAISTDRRKLRTFAIDCIGKFDARAPANDHIVELLRLVGTTLTSLALRADDINDASLEASLLLCPQLEHLRLDGLAIQTTGSLTTAYRHGIKISSLDLRGLSIPVEAFERFLETLATTTSAASRHLRKFRFGSKWNINTTFREETGRICQRMVKTNKRLQHVHAYQSDYSSGTLYFCVSRFHHDPVLPGKSNRLAFLSVLRHFQPTIAFLNEESVARIFQFAATERKFMVEQFEYPEMQSR